MTPTISPELDEAYKQVRIARVAYRIDPSPSNGAALSKAKDAECAALLRHWLTYSEDDPANLPVIHI